MTMIFLDTSAMVRFFTGDSPEKAEIVKKIINEKEVNVPDSERKYQTCRTAF